MARGIPYSWERGRDRAPQYQGFGQATAQVAPGLANLALDMSPVGDIKAVGEGLYNKDALGTGLGLLSMAIPGTIKPGMLPDKRTLYEYGKTLRKTGKRKYEVVDDYTNDVAAELWMDEAMQGIADVKVKEKYRGKGLANAFYDEVEKDLGIILSPSDNLSEQGYKLWLRRNPEKVKDSLYKHKKDLLGKKAKLVRPKGTDTGEIVDVSNTWVSVSPAKGISLPLTRDELIKQGLIK